MGLCGIVMPLRKTVDYCSNTKSLGSVLWPYSLGHQMRARFEKQRKNCLLSEDPEIHFSLSK